MDTDEEEVIVSSTIENMKQESADGGGIQNFCSRGADVEDIDVNNFAIIAEVDSSRLPEVMVEDDQDGEKEDCGGNVQIEVSEVENET